MYNFLSYVMSFAVINIAGYLFDIRKLKFIDYKTLNDEPHIEFNLSSIWLTILPFTIIDLSGHAMQFIVYKNSLSTLNVFKSIFDMAFILGSIIMYSKHVKQIQIKKQLKFEFNLISVIVVIFILLFAIWFNFGSTI